MEIKRRSANFPTLILLPGTAKHLNSGQVRKSPRPIGGMNLPHTCSHCLKLAVSSEENKSSLLKL